MPIKRFLEYLRRSGNEERYMRRSSTPSTPRSVAGLMCRTLVSVDWTGRLYDCDFNQMLGLGVDEELPQTIGEFDPERFRGRVVIDRRALLRLHGRRRLLLRRGRRGLKPGSRLGKRRVESVSLEV